MMSGVSEMEQLNPGLSKMWVGLDDHIAHGGACDRA